MAEPPPVEVLELTPAEPGAVLDRVRWLHLDRGGWLNLQPSVDPELVAVGRGGGLLGLSARGPAIPLATWTLGRAHVGRKTEPAAVGLQHGAGPKVVAHLRELGVPLPSGWKVLQDHPKRGLVLEVAEGTRPEATLRWLLEAGAALCPVDFETWLVAVHPAR